MKIALKDKWATAFSTVKPLVFQIPYDDELAQARADVLRLHKYEVVSVVGNEDAKILLNRAQPCDLFMIAHAAPHAVRQEMVTWLRTKYPQVPILAINSPVSREVDGVDYNVMLSGPNAWLPVVAAAIHTRPSPA